MLIAVSVCIKSWRSGDFDKISHWISLWITCIRKVILVRPAVQLIIKARCHTSSAIVTHTYVQYCFRLGVIATRRLEPICRSRLCKSIWMDQKLQQIRFTRHRLKDSCALSFDQISPGCNMAKCTREYHHLHCLFSWQITKTGRHQLRQISVGAATSIGAGIRAPQQWGCRSTLQMLN